MDLLNDDSTYENLNENAIAAIAAEFYKENQKNRW